MLQLKFSLLISIVLKFGLIQAQAFDSLILSSNEQSSFINLIPSIKTSSLLYRGSRDGFNAFSFHSKCDGIRNTITIVKNNLNYVFGGYTNSTWSSSNPPKYMYDANAFIFTLNRNKNNSLFQKFLVNDRTKAIWCNAALGPTFGFWSGKQNFSDIMIAFRNNVSSITGTPKYGNYADFGASYSLPQGINYGSIESRKFLTGQFKQWEVSEIEVFLISQKLPNEIVNIFKHNFKRSINKVNGSYFGDLVGFAMMESTNTYYVSDFSKGLVYMFNDNWDFIGQNEFEFSPYYLIAVNISLYVTSLDAIYKVSNDLNTIYAQYNAVDGIGSLYSGICYNTADNFLYAALVGAINTKEIEVFDLNLNLVATIPTPNYLPVSISIFKKQIYVGTTQKIVLLIVNKSIISSFPACNSIVNSLMIDKLGNIATACSEGVLNLYDSNKVLYRNVSIKTEPKLLAYDSKGRLVTISSSKIIIFYQN